MGIRSSDKTAGAAGVEWANVYVLPGAEPPGSKSEKTAGGSKVTFRHRAIGMIDPEHRKGVSQGWNHMLQQLKKACE